VSKVKDLLLLIVTTIVKELVKKLVDHWLKWLNNNHSHDEQ